MTLRAKLVVAALALAGIGVFVVAGLLSSEDPPDVTLRTDGLVAFSPTRGAEVLNQTPVSVTLEPRYRLVSMRLFDNPSLAGGVDVTGFVVEVGANSFVFSPDEDTPWQAHSADDNCVVVQFEDIANDRTNDIDWCFTAS